MGAAKQGTTDAGQRDYLAYLIQCVVGRAQWAPERWPSYYRPQRQNAKCGHDYERERKRRAVIGC
jgi:hypothetical protein